MADWMDEGLTRTEQERERSALRDQVRLHEATVLKEQRPIIFEQLCEALEAVVAGRNQQLADRNADFGLTFKRQASSAAYIHRDGDPTVSANLSIHPQGISLRGHISGSLRDSRF